MDHRGSPVVGAVAAALLVRYLGGRSSSTTETYVEKFHDDDPPAGASLRPRSPGSIGVEPRQRCPAGVGRACGLQRRGDRDALSEVFRVGRALDAKSLLAAGAAAGVAAVSKLPLRGDIRRRGSLSGSDVRRAVLPAMFGSAAGTSLWLL